LDVDSVITGPMTPLQCFKSDESVEPPKIVAEEAPVLFQRRGDQEAEDLKKNPLGFHLKQKEVRDKMNEIFEKTPQFDLLCSNRGPW
jgi:hypothetical protein